MIKKKTPFSPKILAFIASAFVFMIMVGILVQHERKVHIDKLQKHKNYRKAPEREKIYPNTIKLDSVPKR